MKNSILSAFAFFLTLIVLSVGYAWTNFSPVGSGDPLSATTWNNLVGNVDYLSGSLLSTVGDVSNLSGSLASRFGTITDGKWCTGSGSGINCTSDAPSGWGGTNNTIINGWPDSIYCSGASGNVIVYHSYFPSSAGYHTYLIGGTSTPLAIFWNTSDGSYNGVVNTSGGWTGYYESCVSKSITQLYSLGQAFNIAKGPAAQWLQSGNNAYYNAGNVWIGTASPGAKLDISGGGLRTIDGVNNSPLTGQGVEMISTAGNGYLLSYNRDTVVYRPMYINGSTLILNSYSNGNVGIGTASPESPLHISSTGQYKLQLQRTGGTSDGEWKMHITHGNGGGVGTLNFQPSVSTSDFNILDSSGVSKFYVDTSAGNVGIGTTAPAGRLEISSDTASLASYSSQFLITRYDGNGGYLVGRSAGGTSASPTPTGATDSLMAIQGAGYDTNGFSARQADILLRSNEAWTTTAHGTYIWFRTTPNGSTTIAEAMRILGNGNVGIGTTAPNKLLHLKTTTGTNAELDIQSGTKPLWGIYHDETSEELRFWNGSNRVVFGSGGNVGIGTTSPTEKLDVGGNILAEGPYSSFIKISAANSYIEPEITFRGTPDNVGWYHSKMRITPSGGAGYNSALAFYTEKKASGTTDTSTEKMRINADGNVGIGTASPGAKLDVSGDIRANNITVGIWGWGVGSNTVIGYQALYSNTTGYANSANGYQALYYNTTGANNTANGYRALFSNTTGINNTANGYSALYLNTTGGYNTANGLATLYFNTTGSNNTANGYAALYSNTTGYSNVANGYSALYLNTTGYYNTANGVQALQYNTTGYGNVANGLNALVYNTTGPNNTANGYGALQSNTTGGQNTADGMNALYTNTIGNSNTGIGYGADVSVNSLTNATAIGAGAVVDATNKVRIGNTSVTVIGGQVAWSNLSDRRLKEDITDYTHGLDFITKLRPVEYKLKSDTEHRIHNGFIAQEVDAIGIPFYGINRPERPDNYYSLSYSDFVVPLVNAVKELSNKINNLTDRLDSLFAKYLDQQKEIDSLRSLVCLDHPSAEICR